MDRKRLGQLLRAWMEEAGFKSQREACAYVSRYDPHLLRHTFAHEMLALGADRDAVRVLGGWESEAVMRRYTRAKEMERALRVHRQFSPADRLES